MEQLNLYKKINAIKFKLLAEKLKKTGKNNYAGFSYYELSDFLPVIVKLCNEFNVLTKITYDNDVATLTIINCDNSEEKLEFNSPMRKLELKGCNEIQALGGIETYQRRYLLMTAFSILFFSVLFDLFKS